MQLPDINEVESYIRATASQLGINPDIAVRVARAEGLAPGVWQSNIVKDGQREPSYGPFQLFEGGGLGNRFKERYGVSASDPSTWKQQVQFALEEAKRGGWTPWYGAKAAGIAPFEGIRAGASSAVASRGPTSDALSAPARTEPSVASGPSFSPSQGPGEAQTLSFMDRLKNNKSNIADFASSLDAIVGPQPQQQEVAPIGAPTGFAPLQIAPTRYTAGKQQFDPSLLRKLGLI